MTDLFSYGPKSIREFIKKNLVAILYTIIFHLLILIVLVLTKVEGLKQDHELGVTLDFTEEQTLENLLNNENIEVPAEWIEKVFEARQQASNRAVNLNDEVNQEISTQDYLQDLLDELESQKDEDFKENREKLKEIISSSVYEEETLQKKEDDDKEPFTGPTTITYEFLDVPKNRKKRQLSIPVYRCEGSALVVVDLIVRQDGSVSNVNVLSSETINDPSCFIEAAKNAAFTSTFKSDFGAPEKQRARITYQFVAQ
ncbi:MAG: hypothetical protein PF450_07295 [Bacteroidales bacterium]|nr:hypothetical protein [Bacteroidales bacterium]